MRDYRADNVKACLIMLVVLGHFLELIPQQRFLYLFIYTFHMPVFLFLSGYFAKFDRKKLVFGLIVPYFIFQTLYQCFDAWIIKSAEVELTYTRPWWIIWYLLTMITYYFLIPLIDTEKKIYQTAVLVVAIVASLMAGFDKTIGYTMSLSRTLSFFPYFAAGFYMRKEKNIKTPNKTVIWSITILTVVLTAVVIKNMGITKKMLYGSYSYEAAGYSMEIKAVIMILAFAWIAVWMWMTPGKYVPVLSEIGRYTMPVFLLHGFIVKLAEKWCKQGDMTLTIQEAAVMTVVLAVVLGNKCSNRIFCNVFMAEWLWKKK